MRFKKIKVPIYPFTFTLIEFETDEEIWKYFDNDKNIEDLESVNAFVHEYESKYYVCFRKYTKKGVSYPTNGIIVHESNHILNKLLIYVGILPDAYNDEAEAYLLQWIFETIEKFFE